MSNTNKKARSWSYKAGERGRNRVRAYEDNKSGMILLEFREDGKKRRVSTGHRDREQAKSQADEAAGRLAKRKPAVELERRPTTLQELFDIYEREVTPTKAKTTQGHDRLAQRLFLACWGASTRAQDLSIRHQDRFIRERTSGKLASQRVGSRTVERDLKWLHAVLNWGAVARADDGSRLLDRNPLRGVPLPKESSPNRPYMDDARYKAMLSVAVEVDWRFKGALVLAHETGHRIGAILRLRWSDVDLETRRVLWRKASDKVGFQHETPLTPSAVEALRGLREGAPGIGEAWVFPAPRNAAKHCSRYIARKWWLDAEDKAELEHVNGLGWHSLRRKFATELKTVPLRDLTHLGGWKTHRTVVECYQQPDEGTMRKALEERTSLASGQ